MLSDEEFRILLEELFDKEQANNEMLYRIAEKALSGYIISSCRYINETHQCIDHQDLMQDIQIKLYKKCIPNFFCRDGDGKINTDKTEFVRWMVSVAKRAVIDCARKVKRIRKDERGFDEGEEESLPGRKDDIPGVRLERRSELNTALGIVLDSDARIYTILTWLAFMILEFNPDTHLLEYRDRIIHAFADKTLFEMRDTLFDTAKTIPWLEISDVRKTRIEQALNIPFDSSRVIGQVTYNELFMKKGPKATISDWVNKMNRRIRQVVKSETLDH